jgi:hypothetical protein
MKYCSSRCRRLTARARERAAILPDDISADEIERRFTVAKRWVRWAAQFRGHDEDRSRAERYDGAVLPPS